MASRSGRTKGKQVIFRRIGGKVIPIRVDQQKMAELRAAKKRRKTAAKQSAGLLATGAGLAVGGGFASGKLAQAAEKNRQMSFKFGRSNETLLPFGVPAFKRFKAFKKLAPKLAKGAQFAAVPFIGIGIEKAVDATGFTDDQSIAKEFVAESSGFIAAGLVAAGLTKGKGRKVSEALKVASQFFRKVRFR